MKRASSLLPDLTVLRFDWERQFHVLKHFTRVTRVAGEEIMAGGGYSLISLRERLAMAGSKFRPSFAGSPLEVVNRLQHRTAYTIRRIQQAEERLEIKVRFKRKNLGKGIGWDSLIPLAKVRHPEVLFRERRNSALLMCMRGTPVPTWVLNLVLHFVSDQWFITTFFPGMYAPPLPDPSEQSKEAYETSRSFWDNHVLIIPDEDPSPGGKDAIL